MWDETKDVLKQLIESYGDTVAIRTPECLKYNKEHRGCSGCPSESGCRKFYILDNIYHLASPDSTKFVLKALSIEELRVLREKMSQFMETFWGIVNDKKQLCGIGIIDNEDNEELLN
jgi:hypothetical protein